MAGNYSFRGASRRSQRSIVFAKDKTITYLRGERTWVAVSSIKAEFSTEKPFSRVRAIGITLPSHTHRTNSENGRVRLPRGCGVKQYAIQLRPGDLGRAAFSFTKDRDSFSILVPPRRSSDLRSKITARFSLSTCARGTNG
jgi:hypothetical protein